MHHDPLRAARDPAGRRAGEAWVRGGPAGTVQGPSRGRRRQRLFV